MEARIEDLLSGLPLAALVIGRDMRILAVNAPAETLLGRDLAGRHLSFTLRQPEILQAVMQALSQGQPASVRQVVPGPSHEIVHRVTVSPIALGVLCLFQDVTDQEQAEAMRRDFVANVSHELRTPLTSLLGFIETLRGTARDDPAARDRFLAIMAKEAGRMNRLVQDLLHLSRVEAQERQRPEARHDIAGLTRAALAGLRPQAEAAGVEIRTHGLDAPLSILADPDQLIQVVTNLAENAIKYGAAGHLIEVSLTREMGPRGPLVRLDVTDHGEGIDPQHLPRLAERFYRVDGHRSREKGGTGLGLAIVKHIAHRHRGRLAIDSVPGQGSTFSVILPAD